MSELTREQVEDGDYDRGQIIDLIATIEQQAQELDAWRTGGVTEEILRKHDGWLKVGKGCLIVREDELTDIKQEITRLNGEVSEANAYIHEQQVAYLDASNTFEVMKERLAAMTRERDEWESKEQALKKSNAKLQTALAALEERIRELNLDLELEA